MPRLFHLLAIAALSRTPTATNAQGTAAPECWGAEDRWRSFSGTMTRNGGVVVEQIGRRGREGVVQKKYGDLRICMVTHGFDGQPDDPPSRWPLRSDRVILETRTSDDVHTMEVNQDRLTYSVNGAVQPLDAAAREWRDDVLELLDPTWDLAQLRGRLSSLNGQISSIQGERSSLEGQISSYRGQVSSMMGEISSRRAAISTLRGMSPERARGIDVDGRIRRHEENIQRLERQIREFDVEAKVARIQRLLDHLNVDDRVNRIEAQIRAMDDPARTRELEDRRDEALARLKQTLGLRQ
jgi:hypothetical protein